MEGTAELMLVGYRENIEAFRLMLSMFLVSIEERVPRLQRVKRPGFLPSPPPQDEGTDELPVDRTPCRDVACVLSGPGGREWCTINIPVGLRSGLKAETLEMIQVRNTRAGHNTPTLNTRMPSCRMPATHLIDCMGMAEKDWC
jgi:hypothetical protein